MHCTLLYSTANPTPCGVACAHNCLVATPQRGGGVDSKNFLFGRSRAAGGGVDSRGASQSMGVAAGGSKARPYTVFQEYSYALWCCLRTHLPGGHPPGGGSIIEIFSFQDLGPPEGGSIVGVGLAPPPLWRFDIFPPLDEPCSVQRKGGSRPLRTTFRVRF